MDFVLVAPGGPAVMDPAPRPAGLNPIAAESSQLRLLHSIQPWLQRKAAPPEADTTWARTAAGVAPKVRAGHRPGRAQGRALGELE